MIGYYENSRILSVTGYEIYFTRFADSILLGNFEEFRSDLVEVLSNFKIHENQIVEGGGGLSSITQMLSKEFVKHKWLPTEIESEIYSGKRLVTKETYDVAHYKKSEKGNIALQIQWNNKDPFYDKDLEEFRKLHKIGELSLAVMITRGSSLQTELSNVFQRALSKLSSFDASTIQDYFRLSGNARQTIEKYLKFSRNEATSKIANHLCSSKFGAATTHMEKLIDRLNKGSGDPCPFIIIGIGKERLRNS